MVAFFSPAVIPRTLPAFEMELLQTATSTSNATSYTFNAQNYGTADSNREIFALLTARTTSSMTGKTATVTIANSSGGVTHYSITDSNRVVLARALVPTGTSGNIGISWSPTPPTFASCTCTLFRVVNRRNRSADPISSDTDSAVTTGAASSCALSYNHVLNSFTISGFMSQAQLGSGLSGFSGSDSDVGDIETGSYATFFSSLHNNASGTQTRSFAGSDSNWAGGLWTFSK